MDASDAHPHERRRRHDEDVNKTLAAIKAETRGQSKMIGRVLIGMDQDRKRAQAHEIADAEQFATLAAYQKIDTKRIDKLEKQSWVAKAMVALLTGLHFWK